MDKICLVGIVPTYNEGPLAATAIHSIMDACDTVVVYEGPVGEAPNAGEQTLLDEFKRTPKVIVKHGEWKNETQKRNAMLDFTRRLPTPTWGLYLDADEVFIGAEYVRDYIWAACHNAPEGNETTAIPVMITEVDYSVARAHRLLRLDRLECHLLSMSQLRFFRSNVVPTFPLVHVWRPGDDVTGDAHPPMQGEPHIHHRSYYRPPLRGEFRLHKGEVADWNDMERDALQRLGIAGLDMDLPDARPGIYLPRKEE